jgi:hypothetical protein
MQQINPYYNEVKFTNFPDLDSRIESYYDLVFDSVIPWIITPRLVYEHGKRIGFKDIFYYIDRLYDNDPKSVIDVGCGECTWKRWFPNIIGFDPNPNVYSEADFIDFFDAGFSEGHTAQYDVGMALCSIHFIDWQFVPQQVELAMNIVKDRFLFTFNFDQLRNKPDTDFDTLLDQFYEMIENENYLYLIMEYCSGGELF